MVTSGYEWLWVVVVALGWKRVVSDGFEWLWVVTGGYGVVTGGLSSSGYGSS